MSCVRFFSLLSHSFFKIHFYLRSFFNVFNTLNAIKHKIILIIVSKSGFTSRHLTPTRNIFTDTFLKISYEKNQLDGGEWEPVAKHEWPTTSSGGSWTLKVWGRFNDINFWKAHNFKDQIKMSIFSSYVSEQKRLAIKYATEFLCIVDKI